MAKAKGRARQFQDPERIVKDYDPEADGHDIESGSGSDASDDENVGTEHYEAVGKSKLRQKDSISLGPQYRGSKVSRAALDQESNDEEGSEDEEDEDDAGSGEGEDEGYADPDLIDLEADEAEASDSEIESDNALAESDAHHFKDFSFRGSSKPAKKRGQRATAADFMSSSDEGDGDGGVEIDDEEDMSGSEIDDSGEDEDMDDGLDALVNGAGDSEEEDDEGADGEDEEAEESEGHEGSETDGSDDGRLGKGKDTPGSKPTLASSNPDVEKGMAIQNQRKVYDGLLNLRIRLQKALVAANTFPTFEEAPDTESEPYEAAEEAAVKLLNTISDLKFDFGPARAGTKRKRDIDVTTPSEQIWEQLQADDKKFSKNRRDKLEKWSQKVRAVNDASGKKSLVRSLEEQLTNTEDRLVKRTRVPRSCAPAQAAKRVTEDDSIYDDADFYQLLLKELVDQRTVDTSAEQASAVPSVMLTAAKDAKARKNVDRKASKGRKMRFTVHEKLQNFMAPEDRRSWEQGAIDRFFGTLFGQKMELNEEESEDEEMDGLSAGAEGLRLFR